MALIAWASPPGGQCGRSFGLHAKMSKCAQLAVFYTKRFRKSAAVMDPANPSVVTLFMSATLDESLES